MYSWVLLFPSPPNFHLLGSSVNATASSQLGWMFCLLPPPMLAWFQHAFSICYLFRKWMSHKLRVVKWKPIIHFLIRSKQCLPCFIFIGILPLCCHHLATGDFFHAESCSLASPTLSSSQTLLTSAVCSIAAEAVLFKEENMFWFTLSLFLVWSSNYT